MSYKASIIKLAIKWTPKSLVSWLTNIVLKGIAELQTYSFDLDARTAYVQILLYGESEAIEVALSDFALEHAEGQYQFVLQNAQSNKLWLNNILRHIVGKTWKIPANEQLNPHLAVLAELFQRDQETLVIDE